jgi:carbon-monoxide dehydrogenase medium subunit
MKPAPFEYFAPTTTEEALALLAEHGDEAKILAGGQSLVPTMNFRLAQPSVLIDLNQVSELFFIREKNSSAVRIGAMSRHREVERSELIKERVPLLHETMPHIAHPQIRNRGTVGGSIAHADPAAELPAVMKALNARFRLASSSADRWVSADDFFMELFMTALELDELLVEIEIPNLPPRTGWSFKEIARRHGDYALVGVASLVTLDENDACSEARLVFLSVGGGPVDAVQAVDSLKGQKLSPKAIQGAAAIAANEDIDPDGDIHASAEFRRHLAKVLAEQALIEAVARANTKAG